jgi:hypothetical protein
MNDPHSLVGLCTRCIHARSVESKRGSVFWLCERSSFDDRFTKYPRLPVLRCVGFEAVPDASGASEN